MSYNEYLKSDHWKNLRGQKYYKPRSCAICHSTKNLHVHHLIYKNLYNIKTTDLRVFCERCHKLTHKLHKQGLIKFKSENHHSRFATTKNIVKAYLKKGKTLERSALL